MAPEGVEPLQKALDAPSSGGQLVGGEFQLGAIALSAARLPSELTQVARNTASRGRRCAV